jgi:hypothetical protein
VRALAAMFLLVACGTPAREPEHAREEAIEEPAPPPLESEGTILRAELDAVLEGGLGRFLQHLRTAPHLDEGRFIGHRIVALDEGGIFEGVDLAPGDTLLRINGMPIERPEQALAAWDALRVASELTVDFLREGEARQLRYAIVESGRESPGAP